VAVSALFVFFAGDDRLLHCILNLLKKDRALSFIPRQTATLEGYYIIPEVSKKSVLQLLTVQPELFDPCFFVALKD